MLVHKQKLLCIPAFIAMTTLMGTATAGEKMETRWTKVNKTDKFEVMLDEKREVAPFVRTGFQVS
jgi:hypothetical protein